MTDDDREIDSIEGCGNNGAASGSASIRKELDELLDELSQDLPIEAVEAHETRLKARVLSLLDDAEHHRAEAIRALSKVGLITKLKSYAVKAAHPSGYSVFLQQPGQGFSFQLHVEPKYELFHVLSTSRFSRVFLAPEAVWSELADRQRIATWLEGEPDEQLDCFAVSPEPGDVFPIDRTDIVHTVLGCFLEEFATHSTDLVRRLHDQNLGRQRPAAMNGEYTRRTLASMPWVEPRRVLRVSSTGWQVAALKPTGPENALEWRVDCGPVVARWIRLREGGRIGLRAAPGRLTFVRVTDGAVAAACVDQTGSLLVRHERLERGGCFVVPPGGRAEVEPIAGEDTAVSGCASVHEAPLEKALAGSGPAEV